MRETELPDMPGTVSANGVPGSRSTAPRRQALGAGRSDGTFGVRSDALSSPPKRRPRIVQP